jgi:hypothetical protein
MLNLKPLNWTGSSYDKCRFTICTAQKPIEAVLRAGSDRLGYSPNRHRVNP